LLKAYQAGARATRRALTARAGLSEEQIANLSEQSRKNAVANDRSIRLLLTDIHRDYDIKKSLPLFIAQMRRFGLDVLKEAEKQFRTQVHRDDIRDRSSYFAAIARRCYEAYRRRQIIAQQQKDQDQIAERHRLNFEAQHAYWHANPAAWLNDALTALAHQWLPQQQALLFDGIGLARGWLNCSLNHLIRTNGPIATIDIALGVFRQFETADPLNLGSHGLQTIYSILKKTLEKIDKPKTDCKLTFVATILRNTGPPLRPTP